MADAEATDAAVSNNQLDADSLEFATNTNLPLTAAKASPGGAAPSLQELIEAELSVRLLQPDSLESPISPTLHSLASFDSIEPASTRAAPALSLDSLTGFDSLKDHLGQVDVESGIDILSPTKLDEFSNPDSLESSSDMLGSPTQYSPEPPTEAVSAGGNSQFLLMEEEQSNPYTQQKVTNTVENSLLIVEEDDLIVTDEDSHPASPTSLNLDSRVSPQLESATVLAAEEENDINYSNLAESQLPQPFLKITKRTELLSVETHSHSGSGSEEQLHFSESSADKFSTSDSYTSNDAVTEDDIVLHTSDEAVTDDDAARRTSSEAVTDDDAVLHTSDEAMTEGDAVLCTSDEAVTDDLRPSDGDVTDNDAVLRNTSDENQESDRSPSDAWTLAVDSLADSPAIIEKTLSVDKNTRTTPLTVCETHTEITSADTVFSSNSRSSSQDVNTFQESPSSSQYVNTFQETPSSSQDVNTFQESPSSFQDVNYFQESLLSSQDASISPDSPFSPFMPPPSLLDTPGALPMSGTNNVCVGVSSNVGDMELGMCDATISSDGDGEVTSPAPSSGSGGHHIIPDSNSNSHDSRHDHGDSWEHQDEDDDVGDPRRRYFSRNDDDEEDEAEEGPRRTALIKYDNEEMRDEERGEGAVETNILTTEGEACVDQKGRRHRENGVSATTTDKKKKKSEDGEKKSKKKKKKKKGESEKENMGSSSSSSSRQESQDEVAPPTPPLFNGHAVTNGLAHQDTHSKEEEDTSSDRDEHSDYESFSKEEFHNLVEVYNREEKTTRRPLPAAATVPLTDEEELAGVSVKQLRVSYLSAAQEKGLHSTNTYKSNTKPDIKADLNSSVNISSLVDTYSSPHPQTTTPSSRPDDIAPISLRSLKSVYEGTATNSGAGSRCSSSSSCTPAGGSPSPKEELNISLQQLREEYCRSVEDGLLRSQTPTRTPPDTGVSIRQLTRSMTDLRGLGQDISSSIIEGDRLALATVNVKALTRSFSDLTRLYEPIASSPPHAQPRHDIPTLSVSVKKLRASYGDLPRLLSDSDSESGGLSSASLRSQSRSYSMCTSKILHHQNMPPTSPLGQSEVSHVVQQTPLPTCFQNGKIKPTTIPTKAGDHHHETLNSKKVNSLTCNGFVQNCVATKKIHRKSTHKCKVSSNDNCKQAAPKTKPIVSKTKTAKGSHSARVSRKCLNSDGKKRFWSSPSDITSFRNKDSSSAPSMAADNTGSRSFKDPFPLYSLLYLHDHQATQVSSECKMCGKQVFQMEKIVAEKASWHKNCFRCKECNSLLTLETYQSHEGVLYCKPHFKDLFRPKAVIEDPDEARRDRSTDKPDYGLEDLSAANLKQKFAMFELISTEEEQRPEPIPVRRSQSLLNRAAKFMHSDDDDYGVENAELGEYEEYDEEEDEEQDDEEGEEDDEEHGDQAITKKGRPTSFSGLHDLKAGWLQKNRREELSRKRREDLSKFRQMLCAGKNITTREMFESGNFEDQDKRPKRKEPIAIEGRPAAKNLREKFERGLSMDEDENHERREVDDVLKNAETASKARNLFKKIDSAVSEEGSEVVMRPRSSAQARKENRLSREGIDVEEQELGRDPNLIRCTDNYEDEVDCRKTRSVLEMFKRMEMQSEEEEDRGPRPLKRFTPPPEGEGDDDSEEDEDSDEEYSDEDEEEDSEEDDEDDDDETERKPKYKDEILEMVKSSQSARKAASLRAKFEKWESEVERNNEYNRGDIPEGDEECMPSIDTARNLRAMFENKAQEASRPVTNRPKIKVNRFV